MIIDKTKTVQSLFRDAQEALNCNAETFGHLECLFKAIIDCTDKHNQANNLAKVGHYLTSDFGNLNDCALGNKNQRSESWITLSQSAKIKNVSQQTSIKLTLTQYKVFASISKIGILHSSYLAQQEKRSLNGYVPHHIALFKLIIY